MELSDYILGLWRMDAWGNSAQQNLTLIHQCLELGIDTFDQANIYGWEPSCEEILGETLALSPVIRDKMKIISKFNICAHGLPAGQAKHYDTSYENTLASVELSLQRMGIDHLDLLLIHRQDVLMNARATSSAFISTS